MIKLTLGKIVSKYPNIVPVLNKYKIDYCCGGNDTLEKAIIMAGLDKETIINELNMIVMNQRDDEVKDWTEASLSDVIDYILDTHHVFMRETLDELNSLMFKILKVHYRNHGEHLLHIHGLFGALKTELEAHLVKEEENLFPKIREYELSKDKTLRDSIIIYMQETEGEHEAAGDIFKKLAIATDDYQVPDDVCLTYKRVYYLLDTLEKDTFNHIHMENSVLFKML